MSEEVIVTGRLVPVILTPKIKKEMLEAYRGIKVSDDFLEDYFLDEFYDEYIQLQGQWYHVEDRVDSDTADHYCTVAKNKDDGTIGFAAKFYNGGTCLNEMLEDALRREGVEHDDAGKD